MSGGRIAMALASVLSCVQQGERHEEKRKTYRTGSSRFSPRPSFHSNAVSRGTSNHIFAQRSKM